MPTKMGGYLIGLIFLMFLMAIGYDNNLLLIFTLFLFSINLLWLVQSHFHLYHLKLQNLSLPDGHASSLLPLKVIWDKSPKGPYNWNLTLEKSRETVKPELYEQTERFALGELKIPTRGIWKWTHLKVSTELPFGLYRIWCFYPVQFETVAYPALLNDVVLNDLANNNFGESIAMGRAGREDIWNLAPYQGDESRKISWKHYARSGDLLIKEGEEYSKQFFHIRFEFPKTNPETYLSLLATQMVDCHRRGIPFLFEGPHGKLGPAQHSDHLHQCLKVLSLC
jgi:uncharacterized protein (DUF58 family)